MIKVDFKLITFQIYFIRIHSKMSINCSESLNTDVEQNKKKPSTLSLNEA